jgi:hypothetical protein
VKTFDDAVAARVKLITVTEQVLYHIAELNLEADPKDVHQRILQAIDRKGLNPALQDMTWPELGTCLVVYWGLFGGRHRSRTLKDLKTKAGLLRRVKLEFPYLDEPRTLHSELTQFLRDMDRAWPATFWDALPRIGGLTVSECRARLEGVSPFQALVGWMLPALFEKYTGEKASLSRDPYSGEYVGAYGDFAEAVLCEANIRNTRAADKNTDGSLPYYKRASIARALTDVSQVIG